MVVKSYKPKRETRCCKLIENSKKEKMKTLARKDLESHKKI